MVFAGHTTDFAARMAWRLAESFLATTKGLAGPILQLTNSALQQLGSEATSVSVFGCDSTDLAGQYSGTTFTGTKPTTNTTAEDSGAAAFTDAVVRGKETTQAGHAAEAAMENNNAVNKLPRIRATRTRNRLSALPLTASDHVTVRYLSTGLRV